MEVTDKDSRGMDRQTMIWSFVIICTVHCTKIVYEQNLTILNFCFYDINKLLSPSITSPSQTLKLYTSLSKKILRHRNIPSNIRIIYKLFEYFFVYVITYLLLRPQNSGKRSEILLFRYEKTTSLISFNQHPPFWEFKTHR
jgi:hypothetical protein